MDASRIERACTVHGVATRASSPLQTTQAVVVDHLLAERSSIASAHTMLDEFTSVADNVLGALRNQRGVLKGAHRKVLDVATRLGVSSSLMRIIERRTVADAVLVYGGMLLILLLIFFAWWFTRSS
ncbi:MAG: hypothetical protein EOO65_03580 [Methanosarcinales archaeon]|nr:MAG: hypothetical protein EOO65_03580 [Methanosarcinales archaeon]